MEEFLTNGQIQDCETNKNKSLFFESKRLEIEHWSRMLYSLIKDADENPKDSSVCLGFIPMEQNSNPELDFTYIIDKAVLYADYEFPNTLYFLCKHPKFNSIGLKILKTMDITNFNYNKIQECIESVYEELFDFVSFFSLQKVYKSISEGIELVKNGQYECSYNDYDNIKDSYYNKLRRDYFMSEMDMLGLIEDHKEEIEKQNNIQGLRISKCRFWDYFLVWDKFNDPSVDKEAKEKWKKRKVIINNKEVKLPF